MTFWKSGIANLIRGHGVEQTRPMKRILSELRKLGGSREEERRKRNEETEKKKRKRRNII